MDISERGIVCCKEFYKKYKNFTELQECLLQKKSYENKNKKWFF